VEKGQLPENPRASGAQALPRTVANAQEDARVEAALFRGAKRVLDQTSTVKAYRSTIVRFSTRFRPGRYTVQVTLRAAMNPTRTTSFSSPLRIMGRR